VPQLGKAATASGGTLIADVYKAEWPLVLGRQDATEPAPAGRLPAADASVADIKVGAVGLWTSQWWTRGMAAGNPGCNASRPPAHTSAMVAAHSCLLLLHLAAAIPHSCHPHSCERPTPTRPTRPPLLQAFLLALGAKPSSGPFAPKAPFWEKPGFVLWTAAAADPAAEEARFVAEDAATYAGLKKEFDMSRATITRTNYEVDFITAYNKLTSLGCKFDQDAYLHAVTIQQARL
jgi:hypothetical protein